MTNCSIGYKILKYTYGLFFIVAGADKFSVLIDDWIKYLSSQVNNALPHPISGYNFLYIWGIWEILIGIAILAGFTRAGAYAAAATLLAIAINLLPIGGWQVLAIHDIILACGAIALSQLPEK